MKFWLLIVKFACIPSLPVSSLFDHLSTLLTDHMRGLADYIRTINIQKTGSGKICNALPIPSSVRNASGGGFSFMPDSSTVRVINSSTGRHQLLFSKRRDVRMANLL
jgi:hypothetical protein